VDHVLDRVVEDLIDKAATIVASENIWYIFVDIIKHFYVCKCKHF
jgi:hypothetical protein